MLLHSCSTADMRSFSLSIISFGSAENGMLNTDGARYDEVALAVLPRRAMLKVRDI
jgi:hypothetical protein